MSQVTMDEQQTISYEELQAQVDATVNAVLSATFEETLDMLKEAVEEGGQGGEFLRTSFISWYRMGDEDTANLYHYMNLDTKNKALFQRMLDLRSGEWDEEPLHELEIYLRSLEGQ